MTILYEHSNEPLGRVNDGNFLDQRNDYQLAQNGSGLWRFKLFCLLDINETGFDSFGINLPRYSKLTQ
jgi:hypothetical protein